MGAGPVGCARALATPSLNLRLKASMYEISCIVPAGGGEVCTRGMLWGRLKLFNDNIFSGREDRSRTTGGSVV